MKPPAALAIPLFAVFACAALAPYLPPEEKPECRDEALALKLAECKHRVNGAREAGDEPKVAGIKAECRAYIDVWERCE